MKIDLIIDRDMFAGLDSTETARAQYGLINQLDLAFPAADINVRPGMHYHCHNDRDDDSINRRVWSIVQQIIDGRLWARAIDYNDYTYIATGEATLSDRVFAGSWHSAADGEQYWAEYRLDVVDVQDNSRTAYVHFPAVKGGEPPEDEYPWDDISQYVVEVNDDEQH